MKKRSFKSRVLINGVFVVGCAGLLLFLFLAPEETTSPLPKDEIHMEFHQIKSKKEAGSRCIECHSQDGGLPLPADHPDPYRCLFCHKR